MSRELEYEPPEDQPIELDRENAEPIIIEDDPLATALINQPRGVGGFVTTGVVNKDKKPKESEWERVQRMRRDNPNGLVAGGQAREPGEKIQYTGSLQKGLSGSRRTFNPSKNSKVDAKARHYASN